MKTGVRRHPVRTLVAGFAALVLATALLGYPAHSRGANAAGNPSSNVAVVPGFAPTPYHGSTGVPPLPVDAPELGKYHFTQLAAGAVTPAALKNYDTVILYGILWSDIPGSGQAAIDAFAARHKVVIWDSDATGAQAYSSFVHPFSTLSSGQSYNGKPSDSVVYYATKMDFLASSRPASPSYLDPNQLVHDRDELNDMNAMKTGTANWVPSLLAANHGLPKGGLPIAWSYGAIGDQTGLTIYSGLDADAFPTQEKLNNDRKELALDLAAPFRTTPAACAPGCHLPAVKVGPPMTSCGFATLPRHWAHGRLPVVVQTSLADHITAKIVTRSGRVLARGNAQTGGLVPLVIPTSKLPPNRTTGLRARVFVYGEPGCTNRFEVVRGNAPPGVLLLATTHGTRNLLTLRVNEMSWMKVVAPHLHWQTNRVPAHRIVQFSLSRSVRRARLILHDRAGRTLIRELAWH